jgi:hypothetical protein
VGPGTYRFNAEDIGRRHVPAPRLKNFYAGKDIGEGSYVVVDGTSVVYEPAYSKTPKRTSFNKSFDTTTSTK